MFTIRILSSLLLLVLMAASAHAQTKRAEWPRTFSGQPDFDFERHEILADRQKALQEGKELVNDVPPGHMEDLLLETDIDPFKPGEEVNTEGAETALLTLEGEEKNIEALDELADFKVKSSELPTLKEKKVIIDLDEFRHHLEKIVDATVADAEPVSETFSIESNLQHVTVQSIVSQPNKYTIINNRRYREGDQFTIKMPIIIPHEVIAEEIAQNMPTPEDLPEETFKLYDAIRKEMLADLQKERTSRPERFITTYPIHVIIKEIIHRKVLVSVQGEEHELAIKFAL